MALGGFGALTTVIESASNLDKEKTSQLEKIIELSSTYMEKRLEYQKELIEIKAAAPATPATTVVNSGGGGGGGPIIIRLEMDGDLLMEKIVNRINKQYSAV